MLPEEKARVKIDKQLTSVGWEIVSRNEYVPGSASAVKEALMQGNTESDYLLLLRATGATAPEPPPPLRAATELPPPPKRVRGANPPIVRKTVQ